MRAEQSSHDGKAPSAPAKIERIKRVEVNGDVVETITLKAGTYRVEFGMRELDLADTRWYHGGNERDLRINHSLVLDSTHPLFEEMKYALAKSIDGTTLVGNPKAFAQALADVVETYVTSSMDEVPVYKASDIVIAGKGACASKSLVAGIIIKKLMPDAVVKFVLGVVGHVSDNASYPFLHQWLHITRGKDAPVILQDFMYHRHQVFVPQRHTSGKIYKNDGNPRAVLAEQSSHDGNYDFSNYTPIAFEMGVLMWNLAASGSRGLHWAEQGGVRVPFVAREHALETQVDGSDVAVLKVMGGGVTIRNGRFECGVVGTDNGPLFRHALINIEEVTS